MTIEAFYFSEQGPRSYNQDRVLMPVLRKDGSFIAGIADGVGGQAGGEIAAQIAVDISSRYTGSAEDLDKLFTEIAQGIRKEAVGHLERMATTLTIAIFSLGNLSVAHVGDARLYQIRGQGLKTLTQDQTELAELIKRGVLTPHQARHYRRRNVLTSALSSAGDYDLFRQQLTYNEGDYLLFLTDGSHQKILKKDVAQIVGNGSPIKDKLDMIQSEVRRRIPSDNYTALLIAI